MTIVDANVLLRYLLNDHPVMSPMAREIIQTGAQTPPGILAEVVYVLKGVYKVDRRSIASGMEMLLRDVHTYLS